VAYVIVTIRSIANNDLFQQYAAKAKPILEAHGGKYVVIEPSVEVKEGEWRYVRTIVLSFPSMQAARDWYDSPEYQEIVPMRLKAAIGNLVFVRDLEETSAKAA
jgi:uncharacterized protein (DUF1330 family)